MSLEFIVSLTDQVSGPAKAATGGLSDLQGALKSTGDASGGLSGGLESMAGKVEGALQKMGPLGIALVAATIAATAAAAAFALVWKGGEFALEAAEAKAKLVSVFDALGEGKITGAATIAMLDDLGASIGQTREQLAPMAQKFMAMGITGVDALRKITLAATSASALAEGGASAFEKMFTKIQAAQQTGAALKIPLKGLGSLASMGLNVDDVSKKMGISSALLAEQLKKGTVNATAFGNALQDALIDKGKGPLDALADSMGQIKATFMSNIKHMFEDINVGPFVEGLKSVAKLFDQSTASGKTMKFLITAAFNAIFSVASKVFPYVRAAILGLAIAALKVYIALQPMVAKLEKMFSGSADASKITDSLSKVGDKIAFVLSLAGPAISLLGRIMSLLGDGGGGGDGAVQKMGAVESAIQSLKAAFDGAKGVAQNLIDGLVNGINSGSGMVIDAIRNLGSGAMTALKGILGIASPSKEMAKLGMFTAQGFTAGVDAHAPAANDALNGLVGSPSGGGAAPGGGGKSIQIELGGVVVNISGSPGSTDELVDMLEPAFEQLTERMAMRLGAA